MTLYNAIHTILKQFGKNLIAEEKLINFLADYQAFDVRATRRIMHTFLEMGYGRQVLELDSKDAPDKIPKMNNISLQLAQEGFQKKHIVYVLDCICYGMGWLCELPVEPDEEENDNEIEKFYVSVKGVSFAMIHISGGTFDMGATPEQGVYASFDEKPSVQVAVNSFYIAETPVTQALWVAVMSDNPSHFKGDDLPVERVSWDECEEFIRRINILTGCSFRMPTEAEWEFAARGGKRTKHYRYSGADEDSKDDVMWFKDNSIEHSHEVKGKAPNELGIYDMSGNVSEWCSDWYFNSYANNGGRVNPQGPSSGVAKVFRGGSWNDKAMKCRVSKRFYSNPKYVNKLVGLRLASTDL